MVSGERGEVTGRREGAAAAEDGRSLTAERRTPPSDRLGLRLSSAAEADLSALTAEEIALPYLPCSHHHLTPARCNHLLLIQRAVCAVQCSE